MTQSTKILDPSGGANQSRIRVWNERLVLSLIRRHGALPKSEIARRSGLTAQAVSVIIRGLESDGLLIRDEPLRGQVGQPRVPMRLNPAGVYSYGTRIGRRSAEIVLTDFLGRIVQRKASSYQWPLPGVVLKFLRNALEEMPAPGPVSGLGVAMPFELWNWAALIEAPEGEMGQWAEIDFGKEIAELAGFPTFVQNDASAAAGAELTFGKGLEFNDFAYFFVGTFAGGGIVMEQSLYQGRRGNAGAFGSLPIAARGGTGQLLDRASLFVLERLARAQGLDPSPIWEQSDWSKLEPVLSDWIPDAADALATAAIAAVSVLDSDAVVIDGSFPEQIRARLVQETREAVQRSDRRGLFAFEIREGTLGSDARVMGGARLPLQSRFLLDSEVLFSRREE